MPDFGHLTTEIAQDYGRRLFFGQRDELASFEQAAQVCCQALYNDFTTEGDPAFALVRIFRLTTPQHIPDELRARITEDADAYLTLMGTYGAEAAWCDRRQSQAHQVVALGDNITPMMRAALDQTALTASTSKDLATEQEGDMTERFYVADAVDSPYVPDQNDFVKRYGIQSVLGLGGHFISGAGYLMAGFTRVFATPETVEAFTSMTPFISSLLAGYDGRGQIWNA